MAARIPPAPRDMPRDQGATSTPRQSGFRYQGTSSRVVARLSNGFLERRLWNLACPDFEFAALDDAPGRVGLHFQNNASWCCRYDQFLAARNSGCPPQFP